jgi:hypothetical protein
VSLSVVDCVHPVDPRFERYLGTYFTFVRFGTFSIIFVIDRIRILFQFAALIQIHILIADPDLAWL